MSLPLNYFVNLIALDDADITIDLSRCGVQRDNLHKSAACYPSGQVIASFYGGLASQPTDLLYLPPVDNYDDDPDD